MLQGKYIKWLLLISSLSIINACGGGGGDSTPKIDIADYLVAESMTKDVREERYMGSILTGSDDYTLNIIVSETTDGYKQIVKTRDDGVQMSKLVVFDEIIQYYNNADEPLAKKYTRVANIGETISESSDGHGNKVTCILQEQSEDKQKIKIKCIADYPNIGDSAIYSVMYSSYYKGMGLIKEYDPSCYVGEGRERTIDDHKLEDGTCSDDKIGINTTSYDW